jgi:ketosteroid isomerase-like protein
VEIVKRGYEALSRGDMAAVLEGFDPNIEWWDRCDALNPTVVRGHDGMRGMWAEIAESFAEWRMEPKEFIDAGDYVVVPLDHVMRGRASGALIEGHEVHVFKLRDGKVTELREYQTKAEALEAVSLEQ